VRRVCHLIRQSDFHVGHSTAAVISLCFLLSGVNCSSSPRSGFEKGEAPIAAPLSGDVSHGVAIGDVTSDSALVWFRTDGPSHGQVLFAKAEDWERAKSGTLQHSSSVKSTQFTSKNEQDFTMKIPLDGLLPRTRYHYDVRVSDPANGSPTTKGTAQGEFITAPSSEESVPVTFLWGADIGGQNRCRDEESGYPIFDLMRLQEPDFTILLGDLVYSDDTCLSPPNAPGSDFKASTLNEFRAKHRYQHESAALQRFLASVPIWAIWDDHEVANNFSGRYEAQMPLGRQALLEYWPIRTPAADPTRLYRQLRYGADLEVFILDTRQYRSRNADRDGPNKTMLGKQQLSWLLQGLSRSTAKWKVIATTVPLSNRKPGSIATPGSDGWASGKDGTGYQTELRMIVDSLLSRHIPNVVWLAGDVHYVQANTYDPNGDGIPDFYEFICGPLSGASPTPSSPETTFKPTTIFSEGGFMNFGKITIKGNLMNVAVLDGSGTVRFSHQLTAQ
jgi:alkaline phosphatase D